VRASNANTILLLGNDSTVTMDDDNMNDTITMAVQTLLSQLANVPLWYDEGEVNTMHKGPLEAFCRWAIHGIPPALTTSTMRALLIKHGIMSDLKVKVLIASFPFAYPKDAPAPMEDSREDPPNEYDAREDTREDAQEDDREDAREDNEAESAEAKLEPQMAEMKAQLQAAQSQIKRLSDENADLKQDLSRLGEECLGLKCAKALLEGDQYVYPVAIDEQPLNSKAVEDDTWKPEGNEIWPGGDDKWPSIDEQGIRGDSDENDDNDGIQGDSYDGDNEGDSDEDGILGDSEPSLH
jgi:hypothetical protein